MKNIIYLIAIIFSVGIIVNSCGEKGPQPIPIEKLETYTDPVTGFSIKYPNNWVIRETAGKRFLVMSDDLATKRFTGYDSKGFPGAMIDVVVIDMDTNRTLDTVVTLSQRFSSEVYQTDKVTIDGIDGVKLSYTFPLQDGTFMGEMYIAAKDSLKATVLKMEAFAGTFDMYRDSFREIANSFKLAVTPDPTAIDTVYKEIEADPPSMDLETRAGEGFTIGIPDNFHVERDPLKTDAVEKSFFYIGNRRGDSYIRIEIFDAAKTTDLSKIVNDNKGSFAKGTEPKETTLGGVKAYVLNYSPTNTVKGRVWFVLHNKKLYRIFINWYAPEEADFLPPFEKSIASFKFN